MTGYLLVIHAIYSKLKTLLSHNCILQETDRAGFYRLKTVREPDVKKPFAYAKGFLLFDAWQFPTLAWGDPTLPSALRRFTSEFGMGSGGTTALRPPGKFCFIHAVTLR